MATYRFPRMLTLLAWEAELRHGPYADERAWSQPNPADPLKLDFSRVEFADFGALARALLLLDTAAHSGIPASVTLPVASAFATDDQSSVDSTLAARQAQARGDALVHAAGGIPRLIACPALAGRCGRSPGLGDDWRPGASCQDRAADSRPADCPLSASARISIPLAGAHASGTAARVRVLPGCFGWP